MASAVSPSAAVRAAGDMDTCAYAQARACVPLLCVCV